MCGEGEHAGECRQLGKAALANAGQLVLCSAQAHSSAAILGGRARGAGVAGDITGGVGHVHRVCRGGRRTGPLKCSGSQASKTERAQGRTLAALDGTRWAWMLRAPRRRTALLAALGAEAARAGLPQQRELRCRRCSADRRGQLPHSWGR